MERLIKFFKEEEGATAVEYGIMVALIAAIIIAVVATLGSQVSNAFQSIVTSLGG
jgi:pilus assembly protein Flp/PilA